MAKIKVVQVYRVERTITLDLPRDCALEDVASGDRDLPEWSDERWNEDWDLQNEECFNA